jgi:hypothetical protein
MKPLGKWCENAAHRCGAILFTNGTLGKRASLQSSTVQLFDYLHKEIAFDMCMSCSSLALNHVADVIELAAFTSMLLHSLAPNFASRTYGGKSMVGYEHTMI